MTTRKPISNAKSADLRGAPIALKRAAERARRIAAGVGMGVVIERQDRIEMTYPLVPERIFGVQEVSVEKENKKK